MKPNPKPIVRVPRVAAPITPDTQSIHLFRLERLRPDNAQYAISFAAATIETLRKLPLKKQTPAVLARITEMGG
jgi:hypothetical protein